MVENIKINFPGDLALSLKMKESEFSNEIKTLAIIKLYELGKISSSKAAKALNISRIDFLELLGKYKISFFDEEIADDEISSHCEE